MLRNTTEFMTSDNITFNSSIFTNQTAYSNISVILNCFNVFFAVVGVVAGSFVISIVTKLNDDDLRSRFSLLCVLFCDVILAFSNLSEIVYILPLIDRDRFSYLTCPFVYFNVIISSLFSISLVLSLLCLAVDQVIAVCKPLTFRTSEGSTRELVYGSTIFVPIPLVSAVLIYLTIKAVGDGEITCTLLMNVTVDMVQYVTAFLILVAVSTPLIYAVVLWKISRQRCVHSENPLENIQNRRLVVSFLLLSASYFLLWIPTLAYFSVCYYSDDGCWQQDNIDLSLVVHIIFTCNYIVDPITCAVRMEPIKQKIIQIFSRS